MKKGICLISPSLFPRHPSIQGSVNPGAGLYSFSCGTGEFAPAVHPGKTMPVASLCVPEKEVDIDMVILKFHVTGDVSGMYVSFQCRPKWPKSGFKISTRQRMRV